MEEYGDEVFQKLSNGAHIYFCGLKGMMPGILTMLEGVAQKKKIDWESFLKDLKHKGTLLIAQGASLPRAATAARYARSQGRIEQNANEADREVHDFWCKLMTCTCQELHAPG